jgi:hypothetical protein
MKSTCTTSEWPIIWRSYYNDCTLVLEEKRPRGVNQEEFRSSTGSNTSLLSNDGIKV